MDKQDSEIEKIDENKNWIRNFSISIILHLLFIVIFIFFYGLQDERNKINSLFFTIDTKEFVNQQDDLVEEQLDDPSNQEQVLQNEKIFEAPQELKTISFTDIIADTTNLDQVYNEPTLNVSIKYPKGWTFIDQNKKKKLDGVTFWASDGQYNPPPFIHLEVVSKELFIEKRFSYKMELEKYEAYYNDPEEMQGYLSQIVYIRTGKDEDFRLKLMMKGRTEFYSFQPKFWAILKSFNFGNSFF
jgi:hypothetical protein